MLMWAAPSTQRTQLERQVFISYTVDVVGNI